MSPYDIRITVDDPEPGTVRIVHVPTGLEVTENSSDRRAANMGLAYTTLMRKLTEREDALTAAVRNLQSVYKGCAGRLMPLDLDLAIRDVIRKGAA